MLALPDEAAESAILASSMSATNKKRQNSLPRREAAFIEPMECTLVTKLPDGVGWLYECRFSDFAIERTFDRNGGNSSLPKRVSLLLAS